MSHIKAPGLIGPLEVTFKGKPLSGASSQPAELQQFCAFYSRLIYSSLCCPSFVSPFSHPSSFFCVCVFALSVLTAGLRPLKEGGRARLATLESTSGTRAAVGSVTTSLPPRRVCGASDWELFCGPAAGGKDQVCYVLLA